MAASIKLKGREIPLLYTTFEMKLIAEQIAPIQKAIRIMLGKNPDTGEDQDGTYGSAEQVDAIGKMVCILGNAGLEEAGEAPDLTEKAVLRVLKPSELGDIMNSVIIALNEGMESEIPEQPKDEGPVDVTLEEMKKKKAREA